MQTPTDNEPTFEPRAPVFTTPRNVVNAVVPLVISSDVHSVLDPAAGDGRLLDACLARYPDIETFGIELDSDAAQGAKHTKIADALACEWPPVDMVLMNPPFDRCEQFVSKALQQIEAGAAMSVVALLRLGFCGSLRRGPLFARLVDMYVMVPRPSFIGGRSDYSEYAWFCWGWDFVRRQDRPGLWRRLQS